MKQEDSRGACAAPAVLPSHSPVRRTLLQGALALTVAGLTGSVTLRALADSAGTSAPLDAFMTLSQALTAHSGLDRGVGERLLAALQKAVPDFSARVPQLAGAIAGGSANAADQALAWQIMSAWYQGIVGDTVVTYEQALMFRVVSDTLIIRSYCPNEPGFWAAKPTPIPS